MQIGLQARAEAVFSEKALSMLLISLISSFDKRAADARNRFASSCWSWRHCIRPSRSPCERTIIRIIDAHEAIVERVCAHDPVGAGAAMARHFDLSINSLFGNPRPPILT